MQNVNHESGEYQFFYVLVRFDKGIEPSDVARGHTSLGADLGGASTRFAVN